MVILAGVLGLYECGGGIVIDITPARPKTLTIGKDHECRFDTKQGPLVFKLDLRKGQSYFAGETYTIKVVHKDSKPTKVYSTMHWFSDDADENRNFKGTRRATGGSVEFSSTDRRAKQIDLKFDLEFQHYRVKGVTTCIPTRRR